jgi:hypothetical protein
MYGENFLAAYTVGDAADGDGLIDATVLFCDDSAFECLCTLTASFNDLDEDTDCVADVHLGKFRLHVLLAQNFNKIHILSFFQYRRSYRRAKASAADRLSRAINRTGFGNIT